MPALVAARPRDQRGYPALAITPWLDGEPRFAATGTARTYICAVERRCSVCGTPMVGPVWRVVAAGEADEIAQALAAGRPYVNRTPTVEAPGHRTCMLYAAVVCPYLSSPTARRGLDAALPGRSLARGTRHDGGGAVVGYDTVDFRLVDDAVLFHFTGLREYLPYDDGEELLTEIEDDEELLVEIKDGDNRERAPDYLMTDESAATRRYAALVNGSDA
jgi:hypothetical protein